MFDRMVGEDYEQVVYCAHRRSGLKAIIAVHSTLLGPALGGTRFHPYGTEGAALEDVLRLARGMTYKAAAAGLDLGGGKAVIIGDPGQDKSEALLRAYGRFVDSLGGRYVTAEDVGTTQADMDLIRRETRHVTGASVELGGSGDPSAATALGVFRAMQAVAVKLWGGESLEGRHVVISGVGKVGRALVDHLVGDHAKVTVSDVAGGAVDRMVTRFGVEAVTPERAHTVPCDIYSPCALGGVLDPRRIAELDCAAVAGAANNQLADPSCGKLVHEAGILYAPDFIVNAGGLINIAEELAPTGYHPGRAHDAVRRVFDTTVAVLAAAEAEGITTAEAAERRAERRMDELARVQQVRTFGERR